MEHLEELCVKCEALRVAKPDFPGIENPYT